MTRIALGRFRAAFMIATLLLCSACSRSAPAPPGNSVTVKLPAARPATPAPGFSAAAAPAKS